MVSSLSPNCLLLMLLWQLWSLSGIQAFSSFHPGSTSIRSVPSKVASRQYWKSRNPLQSTSSLSTTASDTETTPRQATYSYLATFNQTLELPSLVELLQLNVGEYATSKPFTLTTTSETNGTTREYDFCVKLYPRGGGHNAQQSLFSPKKKDDANDDTNKISLPLLGPQPQEKVGVYLQFLPRHDEDTVDASFALRLQGRQRVGRPFDVEWRSGMRLVPLEQTKLAQGQANDFGAHLMQTELLDFFLGVNDDSFGEMVENVQENERLNAQNRQSPVTVQVEVMMHPPFDSQSHGSGTVVSQSSFKEGVISSGFGLLRMEDLREGPAPSDKDNQDDPNFTEPLRVGQIVVPVLRKLSQRPKMFQQGVYPGVEYRLLRVVDPASNQDLFYTRPGADYELKPIYPLVPQLERQWPVRVNERDIPKLITPNQYNLISAVGSLFAATGALATAFVVSQAISLFFIPSRSMEPTLQKGDVLLVEKISPRLPFYQPHEGDVVLFHPPTQLQDLVSQSGGRVSRRDLFVKRVAATPGDSLKVTSKSGKVEINGQEPVQNRDMCGAEPLKLIERYMDPSKDAVTVQRGEVAVLGDCSSVSVDSRVWGPLNQQEIVGRPVIRLWPLNRFGPTESLPSTISSATNDWKD